MKGPYVRLSVGYRENAKVLGVSALAELLFVRSLAYSKANRTNGAVPASDLGALAGGFEEYDANPDRLADELVRERLWDPTPSGWVIHGWHEWNRPERHPRGFQRPAIPTAVRQYVLERDGGTCQWCGAVDRIEFDHIIPWSKGGRHSIDNLQLLCRQCNRSKGARI